MQRLTFYAAIVVALSGSNAALAQFGQVNYPQSDFRWVWGNERDLARRGFEDFSISGNDAGFRCTLKGRLRPGSRLTETDVRALENDLRSTLFFIERSANTMYVLDQQRDIDWAELDCAKHVDDASAAELREREEKARAKAERDRERRRARRAREED